jgi:hypothetical protein
MKTIGLALFLVAFLAFAGSFVWALFTETDEAPWVVWVIFGSLFLGSILLLAAAVRDRLKAKKEEDYLKGVDN